MQEENQELQEKVAELEKLVDHSEECEYVMISAKGKPNAAEDLLKEFKSLTEHNKILEQEIYILRQYGNKDCTAMADEALDKVRGE